MHVNAWAPVNTAGMHSGPVAINMKKILKKKVQLICHVFFFSVLATYWSGWIGKGASSSFPASGISSDSKFFFHLISHLVHCTLNVYLPGTMSPSQCWCSSEPLTEARQYTLTVSSGRSGIFSLSCLWSIAQPISATGLLHVFYLWFTLTVWVQNAVCC